MTDGLHVVIEIPRGSRDDEVVRVPCEEAFAVIEASRDRRRDRRA